MYIYLFGRCLLSCWIKTIVMHMRLKNSFFHECEKLDSFHVWKMQFLQKVSSNNLYLF